MNELIDVLERIESPGTFVVDGQLTSVPPGLKVKNLGLVPIPILKQQAKALIKVSEQAPYGLGEETVLDTNIRKTWQISSEDFSLTNPQWEHSLQESVNKIAIDLGLHGCNIAFEQYKLLIYEKGSFFNIHRDTEKVPNMFATLVVNLPSEHEGGQLTVTHGDITKHYSFTKSDSFHPSFVAFYADCFHEVKPITSGYRVCLIYNLSISNRAEQPRLSKQLEVVKEVGRCIKQWQKKKTEQPILTYLLEHDYTEKNLSFENLKNGDLSKARVLMDAAEKNNCQAFLCLVTYYRNSYGDVGYYSYDDDDLDEDDFEECDVSDEEIYAHHFITKTGTHIKVKKLSLEEDDLLATIPLLDGPGRDVSISEATGNEGATKELWYHRGAVVLWADERAFEVVLDMDLDYGIYFFKEFIKKNQPLNASNRQKVMPLAAHIIKKRHSYREEDISQELIEIGDIELLKAFIHKRMNSYDINIKGEKLIPILEQFGWQHFSQQIIADLSSKRDVMKWINSLLQIKESISDEGQVVIAHWFDTFWKSSLNNELSHNNISYIVQNVALLKQETFSDDIIHSLSAKMNGEFITQTYGTALMDALQKLKNYDYDHSVFHKFSANIRQQIQYYFPSAPKKPENWFRKGSLQCTCQFCKQTNQFLLDPDESTLHINKTIKRNLLHVEDEIRKSRVDVSIHINKVPPKFQGILTKNQNEYDYKQTQFDQAQKIIKNLQSD